MEDESPHGRDPALKAVSIYGCGVRILRLPQRVFSIMEMRRHGLSGKRFDSALIHLDKFPKQSYSSVVRATCSLVTAPSLHLGPEEFDPLVAH